MEDTKKNLISNREPKKQFRFVKLSSIVKPEESRFLPSLNNGVKMEEDYGFFDMSCETDSEDESSTPRIIRHRDNANDFPKYIVCRNFRVLDKFTFVSVSIIDVRIIKNCESHDDLYVVQFYVRLQVNEEVLFKWKGMYDLGELTFSTMLHIEQEKIPLATVTKMQVLLDPLEAVLKAWEKLEELQNVKLTIFSQHRKAVEFLFETILFEIYDLKILLNFFLKA